MKINIKPLSVNQCWRGRRFKTNAYIDYETEMLWTLPKSGLKIYKRNWLKIKWGLSSRNSDIDNPLKPFLDLLQKQYNFNDKTIYKLEVEKEIIAKGKEFINFEIKNYDSL